MVSVKPVTALAGRYMKINVTTLSFRHFRKKGDIWIMPSLLTFLLTIELWLEWINKAFYGVWKGRQQALSNQDLCYCWKRNCIISTGFEKWRNQQLVANIALPQKCYRISQLWCNSKVVGVQTGKHREDAYQRRLSISKSVVLGNVFGVFATCCQGST